MIISYTHAPEPNIDTPKWWFLMLKMSKGVLIWTSPTKTATPPKLLRHPHTFSSSGIANAIVALPLFRWDDFSPTALMGFSSRATVESIRRFVNNTASPKSYQTHLPAMRFLGVLKILKSLFYMFYGYVLLGVTRSLRDCCVASWQLFVNLACLSWTLMHQCDNSTIFFPEQSPCNMLEEFLINWTWIIFRIMLHHFFHIFILYCQNFPTTYRIEYYPSLSSTIHWTVNIMSELLPYEWTTASLAMSLNDKKIH